LAYDNLGRRTSLSQMNGVTMAYGYDSASSLTSLTSLTQDLAGTASDQAYGYAYNAAGEITSRAASNDA
jgi:YD repeat-containing protein